MDRELLAKNLMNVLNVKDCRNYIIFETENLYTVLYHYIEELVGKENQDAMKDIESFMTTHETTIDKIAKNQMITVDEKNELIESLIAFKKKHLKK